MEVFWGIAIPFLGTTLGAAMVFFMKNKINSKIEKLLNLAWVCIWCYGSCICMVAFNAIN